MRAGCAPLPAIKSLPACARYSRGIVAFFGVPIAVAASGSGVAFSSAASFAVSRRAAVGRGAEAGLLAGQLRLFDNHQAPSLSAGRRQRGSGSSLQTACRGRAFPPFGCSRAGLLEADDRRVEPLWNLAGCHRESRFLLPLRSLSVPPPRPHQLFLKKKNI